MILKKGANIYNVNLLNVNLIIYNVNNKLNPAKVDIMFASRNFAYNLFSHFMGHLSINKIKSPEICII